MRTFAQFISKNINLKQQISVDLEISESAIDEWAAGVCNPHPHMKRAVWSYINDHQMQQDGAISYGQELTNQIEDILRRYDPQGLIKMGAPPDEYSSEASEIRHYLYSAHTFESFKISIWATFICSFNADDAGNIEDYDAMAKEIWPLRTF